MTLIFRQLFDGPSSTYTYLLGDAETKEAVLVDTVFEQHSRDLSLARELGLRVTHALETHVHADHVTGAWLMREALGARIGVAGRAGVDGADLLFHEGDVVHFGRHTLRVLETPGHTDGCATFVLDNGVMAFTGDCLLIRGAGRTDFQQGDPRAMFRSIREKIFTLPNTCLLYPAHDYAGRTVSSVAEERDYNPRIGGARNEHDFVRFMENLHLPHPRQLEVAVPANLKCGRPEDGRLPPPATWGPVEMTYGGIPEIDPRWVAEHRSDLHVLDVRDTDEARSEGDRIDGSLVIPLGELAQRIHEVPKDKPVVTVCRSGGRSAQAVVLLRKSGWTDLANMSGGMLAWNALSADRRGAMDPA